MTPGSKIVTLDVVGDELHFDRQCVALLVNSGRETTNMGVFLDFVREHGDVETGDVERAEDCGCGHKVTCKHYSAEDAKPMYDEALDDVGTAAKEYAKGGLLRMGDLAIIIAKLKEAQT